MNNISLTANSGIQFHSFTLKINPNKDDVKSLRFYEWFDTSNFKLKLEYAHFLADYDAWVSKRNLFEEGYIDDKGKVADEINLNRLNLLTLGENCFSINDIETPLEIFTDKWIPIPYFTTNQSGENVFGPTNWARLKLGLVSKNKSDYVLNATIAFDTRVDYSENSLDTPSFLGNDDSTIYNLCQNEDLLFDFCNEKYGCEWVHDYVKDVYTSKSDRKQSSFPELKYLAYYIYFLNYIQKLDVFPRIEFIKEAGVSYRNVDLVLDIGNSKTCALLFESQENEVPFTKVKKLQITDLSQPHIKYDEPFDMQLAFQKAYFGDIGYNENQFSWPSILRVGKEASRLIYTNKEDNDDNDEVVTHFSSPKRYLWDELPSSKQWEFIASESTNPIKTIYIKGISEQFNSDGTFNSTTDFGALSAYSRKSLMTFTFIEIFCHALSQINSHDFREEHGSLKTPRRLKNILVTCPTAMPQQEQLALRQSAQEAMLALKRYFGNSYLEAFDDNLLKSFNIIPSVRDLKLKLPDVDNKRDWNYDEATCSQFVFIYSEISKRYLNNCKDYFELYGRKRKDIEGYNKKALTIGSVDIGAGTTDLMITTYTYEGEGKTSLKPIPLFWESFYNAGDNLVKTLIQQIIIEGEIINENYRGCQGVIENTLKEKGISDIKEKINFFFGDDTNRQSYKDRKLRSDFNLQISVPIANKYLELAKQNKEDHILQFSDFFNELQPNQSLLDAFHEHFGFRFEEIKWKFSLDRVNDIISVVFEPLILKISSVLYAHGCDFVLLAGRPTSLKKIESLFLKFYPVPPNRLITLNNYRVGTWYPFQDGNGYFEDQKSLLVVGAMIALMSGKYDRLGGFRLNIDQLIKKVRSTAKVIGVYNDDLNKIGEGILTPDENRGAILATGLPILVGCRQFDTEAYPSRELLILDFDDANIKENIKNRFGELDKPTVQEKVSELKDNIRRRMPLTVNINRDYRNDIEELFIDYIIDKEREEISPKLLRLGVQTIADNKGHWLDTGKFLLSINNKMN